MPPPKQPAFFDIYNPELCPPEADAPALPPFQRHSDTSRAAAVRISKDAENLRGQVYAYLVSRGDGATDEEGQAKLCMDGNTYRPRRRELELAGLVVDSGKRRPTSSGRDAVVWVAVRPRTDPE